MYNVFCLIRHERRHREDRHRDEREGSWDQDLERERRRHFGRDRKERDEKDDRRYLKI